MPRALVTGATAGLGHAFARQLAASGYDLVLVSRTSEQLDKVAEQLRTTHRTKVEVLVADLSTTDDMNEVADRVQDPTESISLLVNNAGSSLAAWFGTTDISREDAQLDLLVRAPMHLMDAALKSMPKRGGGAIINVASVAAFTPRGTYSAHKAWLVNLSRWTDLHYRDDGIRVQALCPGFVRTEFHQRANMDISGIPNWMWLNADDVVSASLSDLEKGRAVSIPSARYQVLSFVARYAPARIVARAARRGR